MVLPQHSEKPDEYHGKLTQFIGLFLLKPVGQTSNFLS
jgi:hypothetical protein